MDDVDSDGFQSDSDGPPDEEEEAEENADADGEDALFGEAMLSTYGVRWVCRQLSHSDSVILRSLFTSQYRGIFLPHLRSCLLDF